mgnify:CR=1 FL=1
MINVRISKAQLKTPREKTGKRIKDLNLGDPVWVIEEKTGLLVQAIIVHEVHVPGKYVEELEKYEKNSHNRIWAKQELGNARFRWFALYADGEVEEAPDGVIESDKYLNFHSVTDFYRNPDYTSSLEPKLAVTKTSLLDKILKK